jgi:hypothetical protein
MTKSVKYFGVALLMAAVAIFYQNCGEGFQALQNSSFSSSSIRLVMAPQSETAYAGGSIRLDSVAYPQEGSSLSYQWIKDGEELVGQTSPSLIIPNASNLNSGLYSLRISATSVKPGIQDSSLETQPVLVTVNSVPAQDVPVAIQASSDSQFVASGGTAVFRVKVDGYPQPSVQWYKDDVLISGATNAYLLVENATSTDGGVYRAEVSNANELVMSPYMLLSVGEQGVAPQLMEVTQAQNLAAGTPIDLKAEFVGLPQANYQWFKNNVAIAGATQNRLLINNTTSADSGVYRIVASNSAGSQEATVNVTVVDGLALVQGLQNQMVALNANVTFSVNIAGVVEKYEWFKDGVLIAGANQNTLAINTTQLADSGTYLVKATNTAGSVESSATLNVVAPPRIVTRLSNRSVTELRNTTLSVTANGVGLAYKWFKNNAEIAGATMNSLNINQATHLDQATYRVEVSNLAGSVSSQASLTVNLLSDGVQLYGRDCASCHGPIGNSQKYNRSFAQIKAAMMNVPAMQNVFLAGNQVNRADSQIQAIAGALQVAAPVIATQPQN